MDDMKRKPTQCFVCLLSALEEMQIGVADVDGHALSVNNIINVDLLKQLVRNQALDLESCKRFYSSMLHFLMQAQASPSDTIILSKAKTKMRRGHSLSWRTLTLSILWKTICPMPLSLRSRMSFKTSSWNLVSGDTLFNLRIQTQTLFSHFLTN